MKPKTFRLKRPVLRWVTGNMAGCATCDGSSAIWSGPNAARQAIKHTKNTGHETWHESIQHKQYEAQ